MILVLLLLCISNLAALSSSTDDALSTPTSLASAWATCASHQSCVDCYAASYTCHWCAHDGACHAKGAVRHGCLTGASCGPADAADSKSCADYDTCTACTEGSWECHWCAADEACHAKGSRHGCAAGTNCYSIDRCQRLEPERVEDGGTFSKASFQGVGPVATAVLGVLMGLVLCCSTVCFVGVTFVKGAVDDLVGEPAEIVEDGRLVAGGASPYNEGQEEEEEEQEELEISLLPNNDTDLVEREDGDYIDAAGHRQSNREVASSAARSRVSLSSRRATPRGSSIKRLYCACQSCYLFTVLATVLLFVVGMSYAPRQPQYNVCTNEMAWKSIVEGMASLKMSAAFDLLISVYNPNRFEVDLSDGTGQFHHDGEYVGSFDIPEAKISGKAISDLVVKVVFTPDKWSALALTSEYYRGNLLFVVGGHAHVKIPALGHYNFDAKFEDIHVNVNDPQLDHTELCACPGWKRPI